MNDLTQIVTKKEVAVENKARKHDSTTKLYKCWCSLQYHLNHDCQAKKFVVVQPLLQIAASNGESAKLSVVR